MTATPAPGSPQAVAQGCTCPGLTWEIYDIFVMHPDCPLHGEAADGEEREEED